MRERVDGNLGRLFEEYDASRSREVLGEIRELLDRRRYIHNLVSEVGRELTL